MVSNITNNSGDMQTKGITQNSHVTINEKIFLTRVQYKLLKIISNVSNKSISEYIQNTVMNTIMK